MTKAQTKATIKAMHPGLTVRYHSEHSEWRVSFTVEFLQRLDKSSYQDAVTRNESIAYYTDDAQDAIDTAKAMAVRFPA